MAFREIGDLDRRSWERLLRSNCGSTSLRFGRDDKGRGVAQVRVVSGMGRNSRSLLVL